MRGIGFLARIWHCSIQNEGCKSVLQYCDPIPSVLNGFHKFVGFQDTRLPSYRNMNQEKLKQLQAQVRIGGKGTARRKKKVVHRTANTDDKKLQSSLKKLSVRMLD